jgi:superfamily II DNA or RNA helicase
MSIESEDKLYDHQLKCKQEIANLFNSSDEHRGLIKMFCGAGKSFIIYDTILTFGNKLSVIVVPSICLITQFNKDYLLDPDKILYNKHNYNKIFNVITVCSKDEIKKDTTHITTNEDIIEKSLNDCINKNIDVVVLITYQSLEKLINIVKHNNMTIDLMCFDEAHHILGLNMKQQLFGLDEDDYLNYEETKTKTNKTDNDKTNDETNDETNDSDTNDSDDDSETYSDNYSDYDDNFLSTYVNKVLFFTATPKNTNNIVMYEPHPIVVNDIEYIIEDDINTEYADEPHCGPMIFEYMHLDGVNDNKLNDFKIRVDMYTENTDVSVFEAIARTILETGNNRVLTFHSRSETSSETRTNVNEFSTSSNKNEFIKCFKKILTKEFPHLKGKYKTSDIELIGLTAKTKDRQEILKKFESTPDNEICVLSSCKTIGEGVDTKNANMVVFVDPKQSYVEIIQNIGRICRKQNKLSTVLIPVHVDVKKYKECITEEDTDKVIRQEMSKTGDFNGILNVLSALRQEDPYLFELCLKYPETYTKKEIEQNLKNNGLKLDDKEYTNAELFHKYKLKYNQNKTETENFTNLSKLIKKNIQITNDKVLEEDIFIEYTDNTTDIKTEYIVKIADKYQTTVSNKDTIKKISKPNRNIKPIIHTNDDIKVLWKITSDINSDKKMFGGYIEATIKPGTEEHWFEMLNNVKVYIDKNNMRPPSEDKNPKIKKIGLWICTQIQKYKKHIGLMKIKKIKKHWEKFINDYRQYFLSNVEAWDIKFNEVKLYIDQFKIRPLQIHKDNNIKVLGVWIQTQQNSYKQNSHIMKNQEIYNKWNEFINSEIYSKYFITNEEAWQITFDAVKLYINKHKILPTRAHTDCNIKILGGWIARQKKNYIKKIQLMKNQKIYNIWNEFINSETYNKYFITNKELWIIQLNKVKIYIDTYNIRPSSSSKDNNIKTLANWIQSQLAHYQKMSYIMSNKEIYNMWVEFINNDKYSKYFITTENAWFKRLDEVKVYIDKYKKIPSTIDKDSNIKLLGGWTNCQQNNYKKKICIMKNQEIYDKWREFINSEPYNKYFITNEEVWCAKLNEVKVHINKYKKRPNASNINPHIKKLANWIACQQTNYKKKNDIMKNQEIYEKWREFINSEPYSTYFITNEEAWYAKLDEVKVYINEYKKRPAESNKDVNIQILGQWISHSQSNYKKKINIMENKEIYDKWTEFITCETYSKYFITETPAPKSTTIKPKSSDATITPTDKKRSLSKYQELTNKMSIQKSQTTQKMFNDKPELWEEYHKARDFSFKGYDKQDEIPVNKIISKLESKIKYKLKILDLGCGRNLIKQHFKHNTNLNITGYDYVENNGSKIADISHLPEENDIIDICVYSQSLMGSNWKEYLTEGKRVLRYNGEMIISESVERYNIVKEYLETELEMNIINADYNETQRWFYINAIKQ